MARSRPYFRKGQLVRFVGVAPELKDFINSDSLTEAVDWMKQNNWKKPKDCWFETDKIYWIKRGGGWSVRIGEMAGDRDYWFPTYLFKRISPAEQRVINKENKRKERELLYGKPPAKTTVKNLISDIRKLL